MAVWAARCIVNALGETVMPDCNPENEMFTFPTKPFSGTTPTCIADEPPGAIATETGVTDNAKDGFGDCDAPDGAPPQLAQSKDSAHRSSTLPRCLGPITFFIDTG